MDKEYSVGNQNEPQNINRSERQVGNFENEIINVHLYNQKQNSHFQALNGMLNCFKHVKFSIKSNTFH